jgi:hypothetical protein
VRFGLLVPCDERNGGVKHVSPGPKPVTKLAHTIDPITAVDLLGDVAVSPIVSNGATGMMAGGRF